MLSDAEWRTLRRHLLIAFAVVGAVLLLAGVVLALLGVAAVLLA